MRPARILRKEDMSAEHQMRTVKLYNLDMCYSGDCIGDTWPPLMPSHAEPSGLINFMVGNADENGDKYVHFYLDDYRFERIWNDPKRYMEVVKKYAGALMPDFSTYTEMPLFMQMWNVYRMRAISWYWQRNGIDVIPLLTWSDERSYEFCFSGLPIGGTYTSSNVGCITQDGKCIKKHLEGLYEGVRTVKPDLLVMYGTKMDLDVPCEVLWFKNDNLSRLRKVDERKRAQRKAAEAARAQRKRMEQDIVGQYEQSILDRIFKPPTDRVVPEEDQLEVFGRIDSGKRMVDEYRGGSD